MNDSGTSMPARTLPAGAMVGYYRVVAFIGAGGMGEVYRAHDTRLSRDVALKIIPTTYGSDSERVRRFVQEARTMGRLSHPNIVSIFDTGEHDGRPYIVSELLEGETLRQHLEREPQLAIRKAVELGIQVARGLAAAHEKGIIHRDLKPANIFILRDGHLKILDFGLAKLVHPEWDQREGNSDTISAVSMPGTILGSVGYMSPEQVEARPLDSRSDIFSFGVILYEMLAGTRAFSGSSMPATLSAILKDQPPELATIRPSVSPALAVIVRRCLEKRPEDRFQSARDLAFSLEELTTRSEVSISSATIAAMRTAARTVQSRPGLTVVGLLLVVAAVVGIGAINSRSAGAVGHEQLSMPRTGIQLAKMSSSGHVGTAVAISPDGKYIAYAEEGAEPALWLTHVPTASRTRLLEGSATALRFSPDGNYIYFSRVDGGVWNLYRIPMLGGDVQMIVRDVSWSPFTFSRDGGRIAFIRNDEQTNLTSLFVVTATGSTETKLATRPAGSDFLSCTWSPDSARFLCNVAFASRGQVMFEVNAATGEQRELPKLFALYAPEWLPDGSAVVGTAKDGNAGQIWRVAMPGGKADRLTNDLSHYFGPSVSADGAELAAVRVDSTTNLWSVPVDRPTAMRQITTGVNTEDGNFGVNTTPDGHIVWASRVSGKSIDLWIADQDGSNRRRLTFDDQADEKWPNISPDGRTVVYVRDTTGSATGDVWRVSTESSAAPVRLTHVGDAGLPHFTADGSGVVFTHRVNGTTYLFEVAVSGGEPRQIDPKPALAPAPSPDGKWLLVTVNERNQSHLELRPLTGSGTTKTFNYVGFKKWRPDGRAFAFVWPGPGRMNLWIQELDGAKPRQLTQLPAGEIVAFGFDWTRDGKEIVFARHSQTSDVVLLKNIR